MTRDLKIIIDWDGTLTAEETQLGGTFHLHDASLEHHIIRSIFYLWKYHPAKSTIR